MRATHWLIGCTLCIAGVGSVAATSLDSQDLDSSAHATTDSGAHDSGSGGDALGLNHGCPPHGTGGDASGSGRSGGGGGSDHSGGDALTPTPTRRLHLGWQSLLPGSIQ